MQNLIWCFNMVRCAFKWIQYELICTPVHLNAHVSYHFHIIFTLVGYFTISLHLQDLNPSKSNQHHLKRKSRPYSWCFYFFSKMKHRGYTFKWNMAFIWKWKKRRFSPYPHSLGISIFFLRFEVVKVQNENFQKVQMVYL